MANEKSNKKGGFYFINGEYYCSVTSILQIINKPQLLFWAAKETYYAMLNDPNMTEELAVRAHLDSRNKAAARGSTIHSLIEVWKTGGSLPTDVPPPFQGYYKAFTSWIQASGAKVIEQEKTVVSRKNLYAGTLDALVEIHGKIYIVDFKTSKDGMVYPTTGLQLSAYKWALAEEGIEVEGLIGVGLGENGTYTQTSFTDEMEYFLAAYKLWKWENREKLKKIGR